LCNYTQIFDEQRLLKANLIKYAQIQALISQNFATEPNI
jgi:hypothetical protein